MQSICLVEDEKDAMKTEVQVSDATGDAMKNYSWQNNSSSSSGFTTSPQS